MTITAIENLELRLAECNRLNYCTDALNEVKAHTDAQAARIAELEKERDAATLEYDYLNDQIKFHAEKVKKLYEELAALRERKPDVFISGEGAEVIKAIINREMSGAGRYVYFERTALDRADRMGLFIQPVPAAPVAVPDEVTYGDGPCVVVNGQYNKSWAEGANWMRAEVLRLNSGSKPVVLQGGVLKTDGKIWYSAGRVAELIRAAGGSVSDE